ITDAETAKNISAQADDKATQALTQSESTQTQLDTIVINGDSSVEAAQARVSTTGTAYGTLKQRLDSEYQEVTTQLAQSEKELLRVERSPFFDGKAAFAYVDDDGATEVLTVLKPMFDQFGAKFTMAIVTDWIGTSGFL